MTEPQTGASVAAQPEAGTRFSARGTVCACGTRMRLQHVKPHLKAREVEVWMFACPRCKHRLHVIRPLGVDV